MKNKWVRYALGLRNGNESGAVIVVVAIVLIVLIAIAALAVDVGYLLASRNELQNAADASALAATRRLGAIYEGLTYSQQQSYDAAVVSRYNRRRLKQVYSRTVLLGLIF